MKAMILAAGLGTRLQPLTDKLPKALIPIGNKTLLQWQIEQLIKADIKDITINIHHKPTQIINYLAENNNFGCNIHLSHEKDLLLDTGGGIVNAFKEQKTDEPVLVVNVDIISNIDLTALRDFYERNLNNRLGGVIVVSDRQTERYLLFNDENILSGWTNIKTGEIKYARHVTILNSTTSYHPLAFNGIQVISPTLFDETSFIIQKKGRVFSIIDWYLSLLEHNIVGYVPNHFQIVDAGKIAQLPTATALMNKLNQ